MILLLLACVPKPTEPELSDLLADVAAIAGPVEVADAAVKDAAEPIGPWPIPESPEPPALRTLEGLSLAIQVSQATDPGTGAAWWMAADQDGGARPVLVPLSIWRAIEMDLADSLDERLAEPTPQGSVFELLDERRRSVYADADARETAEREQLQTIHGPVAADLRPLRTWDFTMSRVHAEQIRTALVAMGNDPGPVEVDDDVVLVRVDGDADTLIRVLGFGGWNANPFPHEHGLIHRYWETEYGARLVFAGSDVLEFAVARPPATVLSLQQLTWSQLQYCDDIVYQGVGDLPSLAAQLNGAPQWFFWWD